MDGEDGGPPWSMPHSHEVSDTRNLKIKKNLSQDTLSNGVMLDVNKYSGQCRHNIKDEPFSDVTRKCSIICRARKLDNIANLILQI